MLPFFENNDYSQNNLMDDFRYGALKSPEKPFYISSNASVSYGQTYEWAEKLTWIFKNVYGVQAGEHILVSTRNIEFFPPLLAALENIKANVSMYSFMAPVEEIERAISLVNPAVFVTDNVKYLDALKGSNDDIKVLGIGVQFDEKHNMVDLLEHTPTLGEPIKSKSDDVPKLNLFSSGTTGKPKAIVNCTQSFRLSALHLIDSLAIGRSDKVYVPVPFFHVYGILGIEGAAASNATIVSIEKYTAEDSLHLLQDARATVYFGVATMYSRELNVNAHEKVDLPWLRIGLVAGAPCPEKVFQAYEDTFNCVLMQSYGMTETAATLTITKMSYPDDVRSSCVGNPVNGAEIKLDPTTHEVLCKTPCLAKGTIRSDGFHALSLEDGWFRTGDIGNIDFRGHLHIVGRIKEMIIRGGINIFPAEVENIYHDNASIVECCLVGYADDELGERTCLCCSLNRKGITSKELRDFAKNKIDRTKIPDVVWTMDELPHLSNGKIDKKELEAQVAGYVSHIHLDLPKERPYE